VTVALDAVRHYAAGPPAFCACEFLYELGAMHVDQRNLKFSPSDERQKFIFKDMVSLVHFFASLPRPTVEARAYDRMPS
jgi:hypothetical protein